MGSERPVPAHRPRRREVRFLLLAAASTLVVGAGCRPEHGRADGSTPPPPDAARAQLPLDAPTAGLLGPSGSSSSAPAAFLADSPTASVTPPRLAAGWVAADAPRLYLPDDLSLLVGAGDGVFAQYGFAWAARRSYRAEREVARMVRVEVYAFETADGARGRYDHDGRASGRVWSAEPPPAVLAGKVDAARIDGEQARLTRGRFFAVLRYEDAAETDPATRSEAAAPVLLEFAGALGETLHRSGERRADPLSP